MHMSHMKRDRFLSYWLCDTWTLKIKKEHDMHNQTSGIHQKWGFNSQQSKGKGQMLPFASKLVNDICTLFIKCKAIWYSDWNPARMTVQLCNLGYSRLTEPVKVRCLDQCSKMQFITFQNFHIQTWFSQFLWFFSLKCWFKGQMISRIHLILPNAYKLMCFDRNINGNRDVKFLECDKWSLHWYKNLTLVCGLNYYTVKCSVRGSVTKGHV